MTPAPFRYRNFDTPLGRFVLMEDEHGGLSSEWADAWPTECDLSEGHHTPRLRPDLSGQITRYFRGDALQFDLEDVPAGSPFYRQCWRACLAIPHGETRSYAQLATMAGSPAAARAAGQSMRHNRLPVIIPCHRVVAADGRLHGFAGSCDAEGPELCRKRELLDLERTAAILPT